MHCLSLKSVPQIEKGLHQGDLHEWRLDLFDKIDFSSLLSLREKLEVPLILTWRNGSLEEIDEALQLKPDYFDFDYCTPFLEKIHRIKTKIILSYHNFQETPDNLEEIFQELKQKKAHLYKMATFANSINDSFRMLHFMKKHGPLLGMCMGSKGEITRILGVRFKAPWIYASPDDKEKTAEGQIKIDDLKTLYGGKQKNLFGLISGNPKKSISDKSHNAFFKKAALNGSYIKMEVMKEELHTFFFQAKLMGFQGLSVTMPLKEAVIPFLDEMDEEAAKIGAVNTLHIRRGKIKGYNTDGKGALNALSKKAEIKNRHIAILGAGGAARALIFEALKRGATVSVYNRTLERALDLVKEFNVFGGCFSDLKEYDILINTTPASPPIKFLPNKVVMDVITVPKMTPFLESALKNNCTLVYGYEMFIEQALLQFEIWFGSLSPDVKSGLKVDECF